MCRHAVLFLTLLISILALQLRVSCAHAAEPQVREDYWALSLPIPMIAYVARPVGAGPLPLAVMNHGESTDATARGFFPKVEFRAAALWFARRGYLVVAPIRSGFGSASLNVPERGLYSAYFGDVGDCSDVNYRDPGVAIASVNRWIIDLLVRDGTVSPDGVVVVGQSGGGWGALALSSQSPAPIRAIIAFAAGRGGHVDNKPNNNCAPDKLVEAAGQFGATARTPLLAIYTLNDSYFGPALSSKLMEAYNAAGGRGEYHLLPAFGDDGHFFVDSADAIPIWAPLVTEFLNAHP